MFSSLTDPSVYKSEKDGDSFASLFLNATIGLYRLSMDGRVLLANPAMVRMIGYQSVEEIAGKRVEEIWPGTSCSQPEFREMLISKGEIIGLEARWIKPDGSVVHVRENARIICNSEGNPAYYEGSVEDITAHRVADEKIISQNQRLEAIIRAIPDMLFVIDENGVIYEAYTSHTSGATSPSSAYIGKHVSHFLDEKNSRALLSSTREALLAKSLLSGDFSVIVNNTDYYFEIRQVPMAENRVLCFVRNITHRKIQEKKIRDLNENLENKIRERTAQLTEINQKLEEEIAGRIRIEEALRDSEREYKHVVENIHEIIFRADVKGRWTFLNQAWQEITGFSTEETLGCLLSEFMHPDDLISSRKLFLDTLTSHQDHYIMEVRIKTLSGDYRWVDARVNIGFTEDGSYSEIFGTMQDISGRKSFEANLLATLEKERELNDLKSRFVSIASHEFRTPLASILLSDETLLNYWNKMDSGEITARLNNIRDQVNYLTEIVEDVMQISKLQEGKQSFDPSEIDLLNLCETMIRELEQSAQKPVVRFESDFRELIVKLDRRMIVQVLNNLLSNAVKFSPEDPMIRIGLHALGEEFVLMISDNGIGIPKADQRNMFQPFYRAGNVQKIAGNGLGLTIVKEVMKMHQGEVTFSSVPGKGTTFVLRFPGELVIDKQICL